MRYWTPLLACLVVAPSLALSEPGNEGPIVPDSGSPVPTEQPRDQPEPSPAPSEPQPSTPPETQNRERQLPGPVSGRESDSLRVIRAGSISRAGDTVLLSGGAHLFYRGYDMFADEIEGNLATSVFTLKGSAKIIGAEAVVEGGRITVNTDARTFTSEGASAVLRPRLLEDRVLSDLFVRGGQTFGSESLILSRDSFFTTCDLERPHYHFDSRTTEVRPSKRVILRDVRIHVLERTIFRLPYVSIPLDDRRERYTPEVGQGDVEGYFVKNRFGVDVGPRRTLDTYLDYFSKLGVAYGGRLGWESTRAEGFLRGYAITGQTDSLEFIGGYRQLFGNQLLLADANFQRRNFFNAPESTIFNSRLQYVVPQGPNQSRFSFTRNTNASPTFETTSQIFTVVDQRFFGPRTRLNSELGWVKSDSISQIGSDVTRQQVDLRFRGSQDIGTAIAELEYQRSIPVGETQNFRSGAERTPVLSLRSDSGRLFGSGTRWAWPFQAELSVGEFGEARLANRITRTSFDFQANRRDPGVSRLGFQSNLRFRQGIYSDDTAQYTIGLNSTFRWTFAPNSTLNLRHNYLRQEGFTPLAIDRSGRNHLLSADIGYQALRTLNLAAQTGYDLLGEQSLDSRWQRVGVRADWRPREWFQFRSLATYETSVQAWSNLRFDLGWQAGDTFVAAAARYDGIRQQWGSLNLYVEGLKYGRTKLSAILAYNGYLKRFEARHYSITYDLHCTEAILEILENNFGGQAGRQINFFIRIKAFPMDTNFGSGRRGQPIGIGTGRDF
ncbi:MAG: hypothetical protein SNJ74_03395 [Fimbriimonadaceae bacterium]